MYTLTNHLLTTTQYIVRPSTRNIVHSGILLFSFCKSDLLLLFCYDDVGVGSILKVDSISKKGDLLNTSGRLIGEAFLEVRKVSIPEFYRLESKLT